VPNEKRRTPTGRSHYRLRDHQAYAGKFC